MARRRGIGSVAGDPGTFEEKTLAYERHNVDSIAHECDLPRLGELVAFGHAEAEALADDMELDAPTDGSQSGRWFVAARGLEVVRAILAHLEDDIAVALDGVRAVSVQGAESHSQTSRRRNASRSVSV